jgi:hypothetical protein
VLRHHQHLNELAAAMHSAGLSDELISMQLNKAIDSYRSALLQAIRKTDR